MCVGDEEIQSAQHHEDDATRKESTCKDDFARVPTKPSDSNQLPKARLDVENPDSASCSRTLCANAERSIIKDRCKLLVMYCESSPSVTDPF